MTSISQPFAVHRTPGGSKGSPVYVSVSQSASVDIAISGAGISRYNLRPTPRLSTSVAISPLSEIMCPAIVMNNGVVVMVVREKKKTLYLRQLDSNGQRAEIVLSGMAKNIHMLSDSEIAVVYENGKVAVFCIIETRAKPDAEINDQEVLEEQDKIEEEPKITYSFQQLWEVSSLESTVVYCNFSTGKFNEDNALFLVAACRSESDSLDLRKFTLTTSTCIETDHWDITLKQDSKELFQYHESGVLFHLSNSNQLDIITLSSLALTTIDLTKLLSKSELKHDSGILSLVPTSRTTILISTRSSLFIINWKYEMISSTYSLASADNITDLRLICKIGKRSVAGISKNNSVFIVPYTIGSGKLLDCVTTKMVSLRETQEIPALSDVSFNNGRPAEYYSQLKEVTAKSSEELAEVLSRLDRFHKDGDVSSYDRSLYHYLTHYKSFRSSGPKFEKIRLPRISKASLYDPTTSRPIDAKILRHISAVLFTKRESNGHERLELSSFQPLTCLAFALSHPFFPTTELPGYLTLLLDINQHSVDLILISLRYTPTISLADLTALLWKVLEMQDGLNNFSSKDMLFRCTIARMIRDFSYSTIVSTLSNQFTTTELEFAIFQMTKYIESSSESDNSDLWDLIPILLDATGIIGFQDQTLKHLTSLLSTELENVQGIVEALKVVESSLDKAKQAELLRQKQQTIRKRGNWSQKSTIFMLSA
ncbi:U3 small nucleolar RNA-associated protein 8 [Lipomyces oligophaga]|uniref:U3 small nucleolar RNA-associated protein 8 n=1 Tax=Lipomyces oligophaga TaxID=45792 RepID=UPI0034CE195C